MMIGFKTTIAAISLGLLIETFTLAQLAGHPSSNPLAIVKSGQSTAVILIDPAASEMEKAAAADLQSTIAKMTGVKLDVLSEPVENQKALDSSAPVIILGQLALSLDPTLLESLQKTQKPNPVLRSDAIVLRRSANRVYLAGSNAEAHAYAVSELLHRWGCRWYLPTEIGECIPDVQDLSIGDLDYTFASPFEVRRYWLSWLGENSGKPEFMRRNRFNDLLVPNGHNLGQYTKELIPPGKSMFNVPISEDKTAEHVANQVLS
ncbi:MAG: hypothetical protein RLZZ396_1573, partial [Planctomycetota bacterium]